MVHRAIEHNLDSIGYPRTIAKWSQEDGWGVSESTVRRLIAEGSIKYTKCGNRFMIPYRPFCEYLGVVEPRNKSNIPS